MATENYPADCILDGSVGSQCGHQLLYATVIGRLDVTSDLREEVARLWITVHLPPLYTDTPQVRKILGCNPILTT